MSAPLLEVSGLTTRFLTEDGAVHAVHDVSFSIGKGECVAVVGESGSGKSVTMLSLVRLIPAPPGEVTAGEAFFDGEDLLKMSPESLRRVRGGRIGFIFQDPMTSLNPVLAVGAQIMESLEAHRMGNPASREARALELLELVGIPAPRERLKSFPHELSGGLRQRVMIAIALACAPDLVVADEPTTALDVTIQAQILELVRDLRTRLGTAIIWISHDLGVVAGLADRVLVMYAGQIVEEAPVRALYRVPQHPYTRSLLRAVPRPDQKGAKLESIQGQPPSLDRPPSSCMFAPRCDFAYDRCRRENPRLLPIGNDRRVACWWDIENDRPRYGE
jgi:peptide/nickel transport system ATP-binding protein/oligopeptide transport system ATP-binding protein